MTQINETTIYPTRICLNLPNLIKLFDRRDKNHAIPSLMNHYRQKRFFLGTYHRENIGRDTRVPIPYQFGSIFQNVEEIAFSESRIECADPFYYHRGDNVRFHENHASNPQKQVVQPEPVSFSHREEELPQLLGLYPNDDSAEKGDDGNPRQNPYYNKLGLYCHESGNEKDEDAAAAADVDDVGVGATRIFKRKASTQNAAIL